MRSLKSEKNSPSTPNRNPCWGRRFTVIVTALVVATGCGNDQPRAESTPWPTTWGMEEVHRNYEQAFRKLPLIRGTPKNRLYWRTAEGDTNNDELEALHTVRRFLTVQYAVTRNSLAHWDAYLYQFVATDRMLHEMYPDGPHQASPTPWYEGPLWIWLLYVEPAGPDGYQIGVCVDIGWWERDTHLDELPRADRTLLREFMVVREHDNAGAPRWKVDQEYADAADRLAPHWGQECQDWAVHEPEPKEDW
jgi:hypothetical protein